MYQIMWVLSFLLGGLQAFAQTIDPVRYIATLQFVNRYQDYFKNKHEQLFPVSFTFNTLQDGNNDGAVTAEDACENIVQYAIGDSIYGTGRTGKTNRGPNDQRPAVYFHYLKDDDYEVYEYWLYYADNDYLNNHEHDWEKYFVYVKDNLPVYVWISSHTKFTRYKWSDLQKDDDGHVIIGVKGGSHAMDNKTKKGVQIRYNGEISKKKGRLDSGDGKKILWKIYCNDINVKGSTPFLQSPDCFYNGDPVYRDFPRLSCGNEQENCSLAPWKRKEWEHPPENVE